MRDKTRVPCLKKTASVQSSAENAETCSKVGIPCRCSNRCCATFTRHQNASFPTRRNGTRSPMRPSKQSRLLQRQGRRRSSQDNRFGEYLMKCVSIFYQPCCRRGKKHQQEHVSGLSEVREEEKTRKQSFLLYYFSFFPEQQANRGCCSLMHLFLIHLFTQLTGSDHLKTDSSER